jgi:hypothetical protein
MRDGLGIHSAFTGYGRQHTSRTAFVDADGDANHWSLWAVREEDGREFRIDDGPISPPSGGDTIERYHSEEGVTSATFLRSDTNATARQRALAASATVPDTAVSFLLQRNLALARRERCHGFRVRC